MSDIPPRRTPLPHISNELLWKILVNAEPKVAARCKLLSSDWNFKLQSFKFLVENFNATRNKTRSLMTGLGYPPMDQISHFWVWYDVDSREQLEVAVPRAIINYYNHVLIGSDHGVFCIRASMGGDKSTMMIWNPLMGKERLVPDDTHGHCCFSMSSYSFGYLERSMEYCIVHVFKCHHIETKMLWSLYNSREKGWNNNGVIESTIEKLGPKTIVNNGCVHWLGWGGVQHLEPTHIAVFDMEEMAWYDTEVPERVKTTYHSLLEFNNGVGFVSYQNVGFNRSIQVWQIIHEAPDGLKWEKMIGVSGLGIPLSPTAFVGNDILSVLECRVGYGMSNDTHRTDLWITILKHKKTKVHQLLHNSWQEDLCLKTITLHSESLFHV